MRIFTQNEIANHHSRGRAIPGITHSYTQSTSPRTKPTDEKRHVDMKSFFKIPAGKERAGESSQRVTVEDDCCLHTERAEREATY